MAGGAAEMMFRCVFQGSITMQDSLIERRPYHRNCECALHKLKGSVCSSACSGTMNIMSFPKKEAWSHCSMSMSASKFISSKSSLPNKPKKHQCGLCNTQVASQDDKTY